MGTGDAIFSIGLGLIAVALMVFAYIVRRPAFALLAGLLWLVFGIFNYTLYAVEWDIYYVLFIIGVCLLFTCLIEGFILKPKPENQEMEEDSWDKELDELRARKQRDEDAKKGVRNNIILSNGEIKEIEDKKYRRNK